MHKYHMLLQKSCIFQYFNNAQRPNLVAAVKKHLKLPEK